MCFDTTFPLLIVVVVVLQWPYGGWLLMRVH